MAPARRTTIAASAATLAAKRAARARAAAEAQAGAAEAGDGPGDEGAAAVDVADGSRRGGDIDGDRESRPARAERPARDRDADDRVGAAPAAGLFQEARQQRSASELQASQPNGSVGQSRPAGHDRAAVQEHPAAEQRSPWAPPQDHRGADARPESGRSEPSPQERAGAEERSPWAPPQERAEAPDRGALPQRDRAAGEGRSLWEEPDRTQQPRPPRTQARPEQPQRDRAADESNSFWTADEHPSGSPRVVDARPQRRDAQADRPADEDRSEPVVLPTRQRPTTPTLGAMSALPPVFPVGEPAGPVQPPSAASAFAAGAQAIAGAQAARAKTTEQPTPEPVADEGPQRDGHDMPDDRAAAPAPSARPAPGKSNIKDRSRSGGASAALEPRLSGPVPTAAQALAATQAATPAPQDAEHQSTDAVPAAAQEQVPGERPEPGRSNRSSRHESEQAQPITGVDLPVQSAERPDQPSGEQAQPGSGDAAQADGAEPRPSGPVPTAAQAAAETQETPAEAEAPRRPREPGVRAAGIYTAPQRDVGDQPTEAFAAGDAPTLPGVPLAAAAQAEADTPPAEQSGQDDVNGAGRAARRQQQRSFGQAATAAALLDPSGGRGNGGDDDGGDGGEGDGEGAPGGRSKLRVAALVVAGVVVVLGIGYGVAYAVAGDSLARNATVAGIDVGGMTPEEAEAALTEQLPALVDQPFHLTTGEGETSFELVPSAAGLTVDVPATVDAIPGGSLNPVSLFQALLGGGETTPVAAVDRTALEAALAEISAQADIEAVNGAVAFDGGTVVTSDPQPGRAVNADATIERLEGVFFGAESRVPLGDVPLVIDEVAPAVSADEVQRAVAEFATPAMSAPVTVVAGEESVELPAELIGQALTMAPDDAGTLQPALDGAKLTEVARDLLTEVGQEGRDATVTIEGGEPVVVPAERGQGIAPETLSAALLPVLTAEGDARQAAVELTEVDPELTTAAAEELGVTEVVAEFTTRFPHAEYRNINIGTAAERIDDTLLLPGEEFSLNGIVGERTEANGFTAGTIINGGRLEESLGGGVSQVATTTFHAAFLAGLEDVEHWPHSIYFDRYPIGQEATVAWGSKDMRFKNDTPYGVVVDTSFSRSTPGNQGTLNVKIWSTEYFEVETSVSDRSNYTSPRTIYDTSDNCSAQGGSQGFDITSYRQVFDPAGTLVKDEADAWTYNPNHRVICGPDPGEGSGTGGGDEDGE